MYISLDLFCKFIIFSLLIFALVYGVIVLFKINKLINCILKLIENNKNNINNTCRDLPIITKNMSEITENIKDISEVATEFTADAIVTKENIVNNYEILKDILNIIKSIFLK
ncbi:hypothetical protein H9660_06995 [Clostridium sp. Sa3CUN1]|uniref:Lipoprotein n=1 Tax=Clostridium gallinarum TaxID=2762246 RepID=A0ABR8Q397_9CLOT|nr:hypothetical protein [Clostridium gallinarum]MBD7914890.1 hypothetical protein [Clostridium gallinarum]